MLSHIIDRIWLMHQMSSNANAKVHGMGWSVPELGYVRGYMPHHVEPMRKKGVRKRVQHLPYGNLRVLPNSHMNFAERIVAMKTGFTAPLDYGKMMRMMPDVIFNTYLGSLRHPTSEALSGSAYIQHIGRAAMDVLNCPNSTLTLDASAPLKFGTKAHAALEMLASLKNGIYIEAAHMVANKWSHRFKAICEMRFWRRSRPPGDTYHPGFADSVWALPTQDVPEVIVFDVTSKPDQIPQTIAEVLRVPNQQYAGSIDYWLTGERTMLDLAREVQAHMNGDAVAAPLDASYEAEYQRLRYDR